MDRNVQKCDDFRLKVSWRWDVLWANLRSLFISHLSAYNHLQSMDTSFSSPPSPRDLRGGRRHRSAGCKFLHLWAQGFRHDSRGSGDHTTKWPKVGETRSTLDLCRIGFNYRVVKQSFRPNPLRSRSTPSQNERTTPNVRAAPFSDPKTGVSHIKPYQTHNRIPSPRSQSFFAQGPSSPAMSGWQIFILS